MEKMSQKSVRFLINDSVAFSAGASSSNANVTSGEFRFRIILLPSIEWMLFHNTKMMMMMMLRPHYKSGGEINFSATQSIYLDFFWKADSVFRSRSILYIFLVSMNDCRIRTGRGPTASIPKRRVRRPFKCQKCEWCYRHLSSARIKKHTHAATLHMSKLHFMRINLHHSMFALQTFVYVSQLRLVSRIKTRI